MRTTLSLDDDVAALLEQARQDSKLTFKQVVNEALRDGLTRRNLPAEKRPPFKTRPVDLGNCLYPNLDSVWDVLDDVEQTRSGR
jgi:hypothetical protein